MQLQLTILLLLCSKITVDSVQFCKVLPADQKLPLNRESTVPLYIYQVLLLFEMDSLFSFLSLRWDICEPKNSTVKTEKSSAFYLRLS